jgi:hypothetical protein
VTDTPTCQVEGCGRPRHGRSALCATHKARALLGIPADAPIRGWERRPEQAAGNALEAWYEALVRRRRQVEELLSGVREVRAGSLEIFRVQQAQVRLSEVTSESDEEWRRAQSALHQALKRYAERKTNTKTAKHKTMARRRR